MKKSELEETFRELKGAYFISSFTLILGCVICINLNRQGFFPHLWLYIITDQPY